jgi:hypothetical protein
MYLVTGVEQRETPRAICVFQQSFFEARLPKERRLLIARDSGNRDRAAK